MSTERKTRWLCVAVLGAVCAVVIGFYAWNAGSGVLELMGSGAKNSYYNLQAQAFHDGHLSLERQVPPEYGDPPKLKWDGNYGLDDLSYYKGKLYLYFGVTPVLVLFWPYAALTGHYLLHKDAAVVFLSAGFLAGAGLLWAVWRRYFRECDVWVVAAGTLTLGLGNFAPAILARCDVYEVAASCGYALTMLALWGIWRALHDGQGRWRWLAAASLAYGLALGARPSLLLGAVILLVPVLQGWREKGRAWPLLAAACGPIVLIGAGLMIYNALRFDNPLEFGQRYQLPLVAHEQFRLRYLWFNFVVGFLEPARWSGHLPFVDNIAAPPRPAGYFQLDEAYGVLSNVPVVWLALAAPLAWRSRPVEARSILRWFLGTVALLSGMFALPIALHDSMCMRYELEYVSPLLWLAVVGVLAVERGLAGQPVWRRAARCGWGLLLAFSVAFNLCESYKSNADTRQNFGFALLQTGRADEAVTQYQQCLRMKPDDPKASQDLGTALLQMGNVDDAIALFQKAVRLKPDYTEAHVNLGCALLQRGGVDEAITQFQQAAQLNPNAADTHQDLGGALLKAGRADEAIAQFQEALRIKPDYPEAHVNLGNTLLQKGKVDEAISHFQMALQSKPNDPNAHNSLGSAFLQRRRVDEAISQFQKALEIKPADPAIQNNLAWLLATAPAASQRNGGKAVELARQASLLSGGENPVILHTLAAACAEAGRFSEAVETAQHALRLAQAQSKASLAGALQSELRLYQAGSPLHSTE